MFIASTAIDYGLRVNEQVDERLNVDLLTDAANRYLLASKLKFMDWQLAVLAYNVGEHKLQEAIREVGSRDAWTLVRAGLKTDKDYYPRFMAAILIMRNPSCLN
ncbi:MAG: transglycosylase SLT domain-containing protein [Oligoflexia bacterium]|nr:transglycosylase SLT domain-containing protein [Oligoflexia bacterium]